MATSAEFAQSGITGQTFREITEKFGKPWNDLAREDAVMTNYALAFAWYREREHLQIQEAYNKALTLTIAQVEALFEDPTPEVEAVVDFVSPPSTTTH